MGLAVSGDDGDDAMRPPQDHSPTYLPLPTDHQHLPPYAPPLHAHHASHAGAGYTAPPPYPPPPHAPPPFPPHYSGDYVQYLQYVQQQQQYGGYGAPPYQYPPPPYASYPPQVHPHLATHFLRRGASKGLRESARTGSPVWIIFN